MGIFTSNDLVVRRLPKDQRLFGIAIIILVAISMPFLFPFMGAYGIALKTTDFKKIRENRK